jgi:hypothetical protein
MSGLLIVVTAAIWLYVAHRIALFVIRRVKGDRRYFEVVSHIESIFSTRSVT